jgi:hypothetical protein
MLTYEILRGFVTKERESSKFVSLPEDFHSQTTSYLKGKEKLQTDTWELSSARRLIQDLLELRERKVLNAAFFFVKSGLNPEYLMEHEKKLFDNAVNLLKEFEREQPEVYVEGKVEVLKEVPEFLGPNMETLGPLKKGQVIMLPKGVADVLVKKGAAKTAI